MNLNNESLLAVPIKDDEIFELLERLAATEEMFKTPVSTIRDVAELTDASPNLIARILGEMRGPEELEQLVGRLDEHDRRLLAVELRDRPRMATPIHRGVIDLNDLVKQHQEVLDERNDEGRRISYLEAAPDIQKSARIVLVVIIVIIGVATLVLSSSSLR